MVTFLNLGFKPNTTYKILSPQHNTVKKLRTTEEEIKDLATLLYAKNFSEKIGKVLRKNHIKVVYKPIRKITCLLESTFAKYKYQAKRTSEGY